MLFPFKRLKMFEILEFLAIISCRRGVVWYWNSKRSIFYFLFLANWATKIKLCRLPGLILNRPVQGLRGPAFLRELGSHLDWLLGRNCWRNCILHARARSSCASCQNVLTTVMCKRQVPFGWGKVLCMLLSLAALLVCRACINSFKSQAFFQLLSTGWNLHLESESLFF